MRTMKRSSATEKSGRRRKASEAAVEGSRSARAETTTRGQEEAANAADADTAADAVAAASAPAADTSGGATANASRKRSAVAPAAAAAAVAGTAEKEEEEVEGLDSGVDTAATRLDLPSAVSASWERFTFTFDLLKVPLGDADAPDRGRWVSSSAGREQEGSRTTRHRLAGDIGNAEELAAATARMVGCFDVLVWRCGDVSACSGALCVLSRKRGREREKEREESDVRREERERKNSFATTTLIDPLQQKKETHSQPTLLFSSFTLFAWPPRPAARSGEFL